MEQVSAHAAGFAHRNHDRRIVPVVRRKQLGGAGRQAGTRMWLRRRALHGGAGRPRSPRDVGRPHEAVEANARNLADEPNRRVAQADIGQLPFAPRQFDVVFCLGVVQHTPDSERTIACLYDQVRPGGTVVFDHYTYRLAWFLSMSPLYRRVFRRLSPERGLAYTDRLVRLLQPLHSRGRRYRKLLNRVSPVLTYYTVHPELSEEQQREWSFLDTHDTLPAWHRRHRSQGQARRTLERLGAEGIWTDRGGIGIEVLPPVPPTLRPEPSRGMGSPGRPAAGARART